MRRQTSSLCVTVLALSLAGCPEPPGDNGGFAFIPQPAEQPCSPTGPSRYWLDQGVLAGAVHLECQERSPGQNAPRFTAHSGVTTLVAGGSTELVLSVAGIASPLANTPVMMMVEGERVLTTLFLSSGEGDGDGEVRFELFSDSGAPGGDFDLMLAFDDGTGTADNPQPGPWYSIPFAIVETLGGDLQFALNWDSPTDVDLHVIDPTGEMLYYARPQVESGGTLDLDSNSGCTIDGVQNENAVWPADSAPVGEYRVGVNFWSACAHTSLTRWRLTVLERGVPVDIIEGVYSPEEENPEADPLNVVVIHPWEG